MATAEVNSDEVAAKARVAAARARVAAAKARLVGAMAVTRTRVEVGIRTPRFH